MTSQEERKRVLVWGLSNNRAGTEGVIYNYASRAEGVDFDFLCYDAPKAYASLFADNLNNRFFVIPIKIKHPIAYFFALRKFMKEHGGEYSALWFNVNDVSNIDLLKYAKKYGIQRRITHIHNSSIPNKWITKLFTQLNWRKVQQLTTDRWACSDSAGHYLYGEKRFFVLPNMVDARACSFSEEARARIRYLYRIETAYVIGMVGRLVDQKNPHHVVSLMPEVLRRQPQAILMFVGTGPLESALRRQAAELHIEDKVLFAGSQEDMQGFFSAMDAIAIPSHYEGMSLAVLEAQFNGLPCVVSEGIGQDSIISRNVVQVPTHDKQGWVTALVNASRQTDYLISDKATLYDLANIEDKAQALFS